MAVGVVGIDKMPMRKGVGVEREKKISRKDVWKGIARG